MEARLKTKLGIKLVIDPRHAYPKGHTPGDFWYYITGRETNRCDVTYEAVRKPKGIVVDPWAMRLRPGLFRELLGSGFDDKTGIHLQFVRDWSPWFFSESFREALETLTEDESSVLDLWGEEDGRVAISS